MFRSVFSKFSSRHPILTQAGAAASIAVIGDFLVQGYEGAPSEKDFDLERGGRIAAYRGGLYFPLYIVLMRGMERALPVGGVIGVGSRVLLDQGVWTPAMHTAFLGGMAIAEGGTVQDAKERVDSSLWPLLKANWVVWGCIHLVTYSVVPIALRPIWISTIMVGWNGYLSHFNEQARRRDTATVPQEPDAGTKKAYQFPTFATTAKHLNKLTTNILEGAFPGNEESCEI
jgi:protein Mpv17